MIPVVANAGQESAGVTNGALPEKQHDIFCKALLHKNDREPDKARFNYYADSCAIRLQAGTCSEVTCQRSRREMPSEAMVRKSTVLGAKPAHNRTHKCLDCGKKKFICGRGLCRTCHKRNSRHGTLDNYTRTPWGEYAKVKRSGRLKE